MSGPVDPGGRVEGAWSLYRTRRYADAARIAQQALAADPRHAGAHRILALALSMLGDHAGARRAIQATLALDPEGEWSHRIHSIVQLNGGDLVAARAAIAEAARLDPTSVEAWSLTAEIQLRAGEPDEALATARRALAIDPRHAMSLVRAAHASLRMRRVDDARDFARRAVEAAPDDGDAHRAVGVVAYTAGDRAVAQSSLREALRLDPMDAHARATLLRTLRARSPVYRVADRFMTWFDRGGSRRVRLFTIIAWLMVRGIAAKGSRGNPDALSLTPFAILAALLTLPLLIVPAHDLLVCSDPFGRLLLERRERAAAGLVGGLLALTLALLGLFAFLRNDVIAWTAGGTYVLAVSCSLLRRALTRRAVWSVAIASGLLAAELLAALVVHAFGPPGASGNVVAAFVATVALMLLFQRILLNRPAPPRWWRFG